MVFTNNIDQKIMTLLTALNPNQKEAVLTVVKTFAETSSFGWKDVEEYENEMGKRFAEYEGGDVKAYTIAETIAEARTIYAQTKK